jgi:hypothetical protein
MRFAPLRYSVASLRAVLARASGIAIFAALGWIFCLSDGCADTRCNGSYANLKAPDGGVGGTFVTSSLWESNDIRGDWLDFSHQKTWYFDFRNLFETRRVVSVTPYISPVVRPGEAPKSPDEKSFFTVASGNLTVVEVRAPGGLSVRNDTCADYYVRVVVEFAPAIERTADAGDASADDASADDSANDGSSPE